MSKDAYLFLPQVAVWGLHRFEEGKHLRTEKCENIFFASCYSQSFIVFFEGFLLNQTHFKVGPKDHQKTLT